MNKTKEKNSIERFFDTLSKEEKELFSIYLKKQVYGSLSDKFDELLRNHHEDKKTNN